VYEDLTYLSVWTSDTGSVIPTAETAKATEEEDRVRAMGLIDLDKLLFKLGHSRRSEITGGGAHYCRRTRSCTRD
jgi:hypothetical protein